MGPKKNSSHFSGSQIPENIEKNARNKTVIRYYLIYYAYKSVKKSIVCIIWLMGGFGMVRNTPTGCGNNLPILLGSNSFFAKIEKCKLFFSGPIFGFFRNLGTREVWTILFRAYFRVFFGIREPEKCELFCSGPIFAFFRNRDLWKACWSLPCYRRRASFRQNRQSWGFLTGI